MNRVIKYIDLNGDCPIDDFLTEIALAGSNKELRKIQHYIMLLQEFGLKLPKENGQWAKYLGNRIYELRPIPNRILYFYCNESNEYVLLHGFKKKTNKTPKDEIEKAIREINSYERMIKHGK